MRAVSSEMSPNTPLGRFRESLAAGGVDTLRAGLIGDGVMIDGPNGPRPLVYADYVASGRALRPVETFIMDEVLPYYANSHTQASWCGAFMTRLRGEARATIAAACGADGGHATIFCGAGATAGINRLVHLLGVHAACARGERVRIIIGPYEHHSNILPWRESGAEVVEIAESADGGPDRDQLAAELARTGFKLTVCAFSAASNITGILTDVAAVTRIAKHAGALMVWDYAGAGPYVPIAMEPAPGCAIDAVVVSPHKFIGGPGASGVLVLRRDAVAIDKPTWPGGGTVRFVSPWGHDYSQTIEAREEAGTPNILGDIRAALAFIVKDAIGSAFMDQRNAELAAKGVARLTSMPGIVLLGSPSARRLPIFSFRLRDGQGGFVHQQLVTRLLSDRFGIQARGGCACAGPYVHRLLDIDEAGSSAIRSAILAGVEVEKPGFTRFNLSVLMDEAKVDFILGSIATLATEAAGLAGDYEVDTAEAIFRPRAA